MQKSDIMSEEAGTTDGNGTAETPMAAWRSIASLVDKLMQLLNNLLQDFRSHRKSNAADFRELRAELSKLQRQFSEIQKACREDDKSRELADKLEQLVIHTTHQNPSYETLNIIRDQVNAIRDMVKEELDAILDPKLEDMRKTINLDFEKAMKRQTTAQNWILGGISIVVAILCTVLPILLHLH